MDTSIQDKIRKLLALSGSPNEHEAAAALRLAHRLMEKHAISEAQVRGMPTGQIDSESIRMVTAAWRVKLVGALARAHGCYHYYTPGSCTVVVGKPDARRAVVAEFVELAAIVDRLALHQRGHGRAYVTSYRLGLVARLDEEMKAARAEAQAEARASGTSSMALMVIDTSRNEAKSWAHARTNLTARRIGQYRDSGGFAAGKRDGAGLYGAAARRKVSGHGSTKLIG